jgi:hypothetical protein
MTNQRLASGASKPRWDRNWSCAYFTPQIKVRPYSTHHHCHFRNIFLSWWGPKVAGGIGASAAAKVDVIELSILILGRSSFQAWRKYFLSFIGMVETVQHIWTTTTHNIQRPASYMCSFKTIEWMRRSLPTNFPCNAFQSIFDVRLVTTISTNPSLTTLLGLLCVHVWVRGNGGSERFYGISRCLLRYVVPGLPILQWCRGAASYFYSDVNFSRQYPFNLGAYVFNGSVGRICSNDLLMHVEMTTFAKGIGSPKTFWFVHDTCMLWLSERAWQ